MPSMKRLLAQSVFARGSGAKELPKMTRTLRDVSVDADHLAAYNTVCGYKEGAVLPPTYLFVCAQPLLMDIITDKAFPFKVLGLVNIRSEITQYRSVRASERYDLESTLQNLQEVDKGYEFDVMTHATINGERVWSCVVTTMARTKSGSARKKTIKKMDWSGWTSHAFDAPANIGRRYAKVSGDYNPIHLYPWTAKLFGFPTTIAHGMWGKAKLLAMFAAHYEHEERVTLKASFKLPNLLPAKLNLYTRDQGQEKQLWLRTKTGDKPIIQASIVVNDA